MADTTNIYKIWPMEGRTDPHALYQQMRTEDPVHRALGPVSGNPFWFLTRYEDCISVLKDARFGKEIVKHVPPQMQEKFQPAPGAFAIIDRHMLNLDPPDHTRLRALVHKAFTPRIIQNLEPRIRQIAENLLDEVQSTGEIELIADYAFPLPVTVIAELLGIPSADRARFRNWSQKILAPGVTEEDFNAAQVAILEFTMYMHEMLDRRRAKPQDDLLSGLVQAEEAGDRLDPQETLSMIFLLLVAGHETTVNLIGNGTLALLQNRDQYGKLKAQPALIKTAVEELLRYDSPVETTTIRWTFEDIEIGGKIIPHGEMIMAVLLAANRDPEVFENPDTLDITREPNKHIAFGQGIHYCLGAPLARLEGAIAINALVQRLDGLDFQPDTLDNLRWNDTLLLHGLKSLPLKFTV